MKNFVKRNGNDYGYVICNTSISVGINLRYRYGDTWLDSVCRGAGVHWVKGKKLRNGNHVVMIFGKPEKIKLALRRFWDYPEDAEYSKKPMNKDDINKCIIDFLTKNNTLDEYDY